MGVIRILVITMVFVVVNGVGLLCRIMVNRYENFESRVIASSTVANRRASELGHPSTVASRVAIAPVAIAPVAIAPAAVAARSGASSSGAENSQSGPAPAQRRRSRAGVVGLALCACGGGGDDADDADDAPAAPLSSPPHQAAVSP